jgi:hypothetical protein
MKSEVLPEITSDDQKYLSRFVYSKNCTGVFAHLSSSWTEYIEPLTVHARHPFSFRLCKVNNEKIYSAENIKLVGSLVPMQNLDYLIIKSGRACSIRSAPQPPQQAPSRPCPEPQLLSGCWYLHFPELLIMVPVRLRCHRWRCHRPLPCCGTPNSTSWSTNSSSSCTSTVGLGDTVSRQELLVGVLAASLVFCVLMQVFVLSDLRGWLLRTSGQLRHADQVIHELRRFTTQYPDLSGPGPAAHELLKYGRPSPWGRSCWTRRAAAVWCCTTTTATTRKRTPQSSPGGGPAADSRARTRAGKAARGERERHRQGQPKQQQQKQTRRTHPAHTAYTAYTADSHAFSFASSLRMKPTRAVVQVYVCSPPSSALWSGVCVM